jgi:hypothetical protein
VCSPDGQTWKNAAPFLARYKSLPAVANIKPGTEQWSAVVTGTIVSPASLECLGAHRASSAETRYLEALAFYNDNNKLLEVEKALEQEAGQQLLGQNRLSLALRAVWVRRLSPSPNADLNSHVCVDGRLL